MRLLRDAKDSEPGGAVVDGGDQGADELAVFPHQLPAVTLDHALALDSGSLLGFLGRTLASDNPHVRSSDIAVNKHVTLIHVTPAPE